MKLFPESSCWRPLAAAFPRLPRPIARRGDDRARWSVLRDLQAIPDTRIPDLLCPCRRHRHPARQREGRAHLRRPLRQWRDAGPQRRPQLEQSRVRRLRRRQLGLPGGGQVADIVLVLTTRDSVEGITDGKLTLGADASAAAGPVGRTAMASTSLTFDAEVYAYSRVAGAVRGRLARGQRHLHREEGQQSLLRRPTAQPRSSPAEDGGSAACTDARRGSHQDDERNNERGRRRTGGEGNRSGHGAARDRGQDLPDAGVQSRARSLRPAPDPRRGCAAARRTTLNAAPPATRPYGIRVRLRARDPFTRPRRRRLAQTPLVRHRARTGRGLFADVGRHLYSRRGDEPSVMLRERFRARLSIRQRIRPSSR